MDKTRIILLGAFFALLLIPMKLGDMATTSFVNDSPVREDRPIQISDTLDETTPWWNTTFHYRRHVNLTDTNSTPRVDVPIHMWFSFDNNTCYENSIRIVDDNGAEIPSQVYNKSYWQDPDYLNGATLFWYANISSNSTATYWIYYSEVKSIETPSYDSVVWFAKTSGSMSGKFDVNYWSFRGDWYNVTMYNSAGGKMTNGAHKLADGTWDWNWATDRGSMHWNPDGLGGVQTHDISPISGTTSVNVDGPLFINYTTQIPFGSYAKMNISYTFYRWGWTTRIYIKYSGSTSGDGRTDEWVFSPYQTTSAVEIDENLTQTTHLSWSASDNKGKPAGFGWWNNNTGISHGTVRISHESYNTNPSYPDNYADYYYRWHDRGEYEFWDTQVPKIYAVDGTILEERTAFAVWNGSEGKDGYMRVFNATSRYLPVLRSKGNVSSYSFRINVNDLGGSNIEGANVTLLDSSTGERLYRSDGTPYSELTDSDGNVTFIGLLNETYTIVAWIDSRDWLESETGATGMNVTWSANRDANGPFTPVSITLDLASVDIHLDDLMGDDLATEGSKTVQVRVYNASASDNGDWKYFDYETADTNGDLTFTRIPKSDWMFNFSYSDIDTGRIYTSENLAEYCTYQIMESEITGDLSREWTLPLVTVDFNVKAYDGENVEDANVRISKKGTSDPYDSREDSQFNITRSTDADGNVTFYRILNGTWNIYLYRDDAYGQTAFNDTEELNDVQNHAFKQMVIPLTWLQIRVLDNEDNRVTNAKINLKVNGDLLVTAYTNSSGEHSFHWIVANDTSIPIEYVATVSKSERSTSETVYASFDWTFLNEIELQSLTYTKSYTELNCTISTTSWNYGDNQSFVVGWYNRTTTEGSNYTDQAISNYDLGEIEFRIWHQESLVGQGLWNSSHSLNITHNGAGSINFTVYIDTLYYQMNASSYPYLIELNASATGYEDTDTYTVTAVVSVSSTSPNGDEYISRYWSEGFATTYSLTTDPEGRSAFNLTELTYANYTVYNSTDQVISQGNLDDVGDGLYRFSDAVLNGSDIGSYEILIWLYKYNYLNHTMTLKADYTAIPTILGIESPPDYDWADIGSESITLQFNNTLNDTEISAAESITIYWINQDSGETVLVDTSASLEYSYPKNIVRNGTWRMHVYVSKANYESADELSSEFVVSPDQMEIELTSPDTQVIEWGTEDAVFTFEYQRVADSSADASGAELLDLDWAGESSFVDNGDGSYKLSMFAVQEAANYTLSFTVWMPNRTSASQSINIDVLIPLAVSMDAGSSEQDPIQQYWTRMFNIEVVAGDVSNQSAYVENVTVLYDFPAGGISGTMEQNTSGEYYWFGFDASVAPEPGTYQIDVSASRAGCSSTTSTIYIEVEPTPSLASAEKQLLTVYYADVYALNFSWTTNIEPIVGITDPSSVEIELWKGVSLLNDNVGGLKELGAGDYQFEMDTKSLGMDADSPDAPTSYSFIVSMEKRGYEEPAAVTIIVLVLQTPTEMTADPVAPVTWSEEFSVTVHLQDTIHEEYLWQDTNVTLNYGDFTDTFTSLGNGTFVFTGDSRDTFNASPIPHETMIQYTLDNYIDGEISVSIKVNPLPCRLVMIDEPSEEHQWNSTFSLRYQVVVNSTDTIIQATSAYFKWAQYPEINGTFSYVGGVSKWYEGSIDTGLVPAGTRTLVLGATRGNYSMPSAEFEIDITELPATFERAQVGRVDVIFGVNQSIELQLSYAYDGSPLVGATVSYTWAGLVRTASYSNGKYIVQFNPSADELLDIPGDYQLNLTASLLNYTTKRISVPLKMTAPTELTGSAVYIEEDQSATAYFRYWDTYNNRPVADDEDASPSVRVYLPESDSPIAPEFNGTHYYFNFEATDLGEAQTDPYEVQLIASAYGYQNHTVTSGDDTVVLNVYVSSPTYNIPLVGRVDRSLVNLALIMVGLFVVVAGGAVGIQRWRRPHAIKQIENAIGAMEDGKTAKVDNIKSMGMVISEILAAGLAELDMKAPTIDTGVDIEFQETLDEEAEDLLGELEALEEVSEEESAAVEETRDYEAELEAEVETRDEELSITDISGVGGTLAERISEAGYESLADLGNAEPENLARDVKGISNGKATTIVTESQYMLDEIPPEVSIDEETMDMPVEEIEPVEIEEELEETGEYLQVEEGIDSDSSAEGELETADDEDVLKEVQEETAEGIDDDGPETTEEEESRTTVSEESTVENESETELSVDETDSESVPEKPMSKKELIEQIPDDIKESMGEEEIRKMSKSEIEALLKSSEPAADE